MPRWRPGVPATLNIVDSITGEMHAFPTFREQRLDNPRRLFTNVQSFEITPDGLIFILDVGRQNFLEEDQSKWIAGTPRLVIFDLVKNAVTYTFDFPEKILSSTASFANDLVVDRRRGVVFITDTWGDGGLVALDLVDKHAWRLDHSSLGGSSIFLCLFFFLKI